MGLSAAGVFAVKLGSDDAVVGMGIAREDAYVTLFTEQGFGKRTHIDGFPTQKRYGGGVQAVKLTERTGPVAAATLARETDQVVLAASTGGVTTLPVEAIHSLGRAASGYKSRKDTTELYDDALEQGIPSLLTVLAGPKKESKPARSGAKKRKKATRR